MTQRYFQMTQRLGVALSMAVIAACRPSDILSVPNPIGFVSTGSVKDQGSAERTFIAARQNFFAGLMGQSGSVFEWAGLLSDEFTWASFYYNSGQANIDARSTAATGIFSESADQPLMSVLAARSDLLASLPPLEMYEKGTGLSKIGEAYALVGYAEVFLAEDYCAGVPLSDAQFGGGISYGVPVSTDSLLAIAEAHFDSATNHANGNDTIVGLASVGLARAMLDRGDTAAGSAIANVSPSFVYDILVDVGPNSTPYAQAAPLYSYGEGCVNWVVADREGGNGLNFISARDPRLVLNSTAAETCDGQYSGGSYPDSVWYLPMKFGNPAGNIPMATGVEAALIHAEETLASGDAPNWLIELNTLRTSGYTVPSPGDTVYNAGTGGVAGLAPLTDPGSDTARVSVMFRERAFWLFGTGTRLGDLRRLVRQYNRSSDNVFPSGAYGPGNDPILSRQLSGALKNYGTDVSLTLPTQQSGFTTGNPNYKGCTAPTSQA